MRFQERKDVIPRFLSFRKKIRHILHKDELLDKDKIKGLLKRVKWVNRLHLNSYLQEIGGPTGRTVKVNGKTKIMLGSYSYLGLISHPEINAAAKKAIDKYGTGAGGVRLLTGTTKLHNELEKKIAKFKGTQDAVIFSSGYVTNMGVISSLFDKEDLVIIDKYDHESIYEGCILSGATWLRFSHNDLAELESLLKDNFRKYKRILIIVDAVYSMDGDVAPMPEIVKLAKKYDALTMVDEAHSIGVLGENGKGINEYFGVDVNDIDIYMGTLSKTIPSIGGYIAGNKDMVTYLRYAAHPFIFSAALPPPCLATAIKAIEIIEKDKNRRDSLKSNIRYFLDGMKKLGFDTLKSKDTAIIPVIIGDDIKTFKFAKMANDLGIFVCPIVYPAVPKGQGRLRCCIMATHTRKDLEKVFEVFRVVGKKVNVI